LKDLAVQDFIVNLKSHLLARILGTVNEDTTFTPQQLSCLELVQDSLYEHSILRVNYTTYDVRRSQDSINPRTHSDIITLSCNDDPTHPFSYAHVIRSYHADVIYTSNDGFKISKPRRMEFLKPRRMEFLWVRWYELDPGHLGGWDTQRLHRLRFVPHNTSSAAFGFLDPDCVIRGIHLLPAFAHGTTSEYLPCESVARNEETKLAIGNKDYCYYYINMFVDLFRPPYMNLTLVGEGSEDTQAARDTEMAEDEVLFDGIDTDIDLEGEEGEEAEFDSEEEQGDLEEEDDMHPAGAAGRLQEDADGFMGHSSRGYEDEYGRLGYAAY
ncbi:hypothetical protein CVT24_007887, partial [Panaeolus cyanescens]